MSADTFSDLIAPQSFAVDLFPALLQRCPVTFLKWFLILCNPQLSWKTNPPLILHWHFSVCVSTQRKSSNDCALRPSKKKTIIRLLYLTTWSTNHIAALDICFSLFSIASFRDCHFVRQINFELYQVKTVKMHMFIATASILLWLLLNENSVQLRDGGQIY